MEGGGVNTCPRGSIYLRTVQVNTDQIIRRTCWTNKSLLGTRRDHSSHGTQDLGSKGSGPCAGTLIRELCTTVTTVGSYLGFSPSNQTSRHDTLLLQTPTVESNSDSSLVSSLTCFVVCPRGPHPTFRYPLSGPHELEVSGKSRFQESWVLDLGLLSLDISPKSGPVRPVLVIRTDGGGVDHGNRQDPPSSETSEDH